MKLSNAQVCEHLKYSFMHGLQAAYNNFTITDTNGWEAIQMLVIYSTC